MIFKRVLIKQPVKDEPKHRRGLFRIRCKILGKVCKVIMDSIFIDNIIPEEVVDKFKLVKVPHVNPSKVTWLNKGKNVLVNEKTWVEFSIVGYEDKFLCDIFPMDTCHLLLGIPWKYDRGAIYYGKEN